MSALSTCLDIQTLELIPDGVIVYSASGDRAELLYANRAALDIFDCSDFDQMYATCHGNYLEFFHLDDYKHHIDTITLAYASDANIKHHTNYRIVTRLGDTCLIDDSGRVVEIPGYKKCYLCILTPTDRDIVYSLSAMDDLTGLLSYGQFRQYCGDFLHSLKDDNEARGYHIVYFNIRRFKSHNVEHGSKDGDVILKKLASIIRRYSSTKIVARVGDDRFVMISAAQEMYERIQTIINEFENEFGQLGLSLKVGIYQVEGRDQDCLIACDLAKVACDSIRNKKDGVCVYDEGLVESIKLENRITQSLDKAIANGYISAFYQPVVRTLTGEVCGLEALARWNDPDYGFLSPADFVPALEANSLITKLDMYILEKVCEEMRQAEELGVEVVPVSVNLSRHDFRDAGCLDEVERIVAQYGIARDMINIEVTESIFMDQPDFLRHEIARFRQAGYQVWMDDFGSGYSSLNLLKDYRFDEIKLDMRFLATLDERSKRIIASVITMAKEIGIQTLAEGVETQDQFEFLREIGCEKAQGYLFSRPIPYSDLVAKIRLGELGLEGRKWRTYHDLAGAADFTTDRPLILVEYSSDKFDSLFVNQPLKDVWASLGSTDTSDIPSSVNDFSSPMGIQFRNLQQGLHVGDAPRSVICTVHGQYVRLTAVCLAEQDERSIYAVEIANLSVSEQEGRQEEFDFVLRTAYEFYSSLFVVNLNDGTFETLINGNIADDSTARTFFDQGKLNPELLAETLIHPMDREAYLAFADRSSLLDRLKAAPARRITGYFRTKTRNNSYEVKLHAMLYVLERDCIVYCTREVSFLQPGVLERIAPERLAEAVSGVQSHPYWLVSNTLMESQTANLFWKDDQRRFIGANQRFLDTYGFSDVSEIVGKTDEDMGWHIENEPFANDEWRVLKKGESIYNRTGQCIIKGVAHTIIASKEPVYDNGKIVGLVGYFVNVDEMSARSGLNHGVGLTDETTGLMSSSAVTTLISEYTEGWQTRGENFAVIRITISEFGRLTQSYGERISRQMLFEIGQMISDAYGRTGTCARLFSGNFVVLTKCNDKELIRRMNREFANRLRNVRSLAGYSATLYPTIEMHCADEQDTPVLLGFAAAGTALDVAERSDLEERLETSGLQFDTVVNALPGGVILYEMQDGDIPKLAYVSEGAARIVGRSVDEFNAMVTSNITTGIFEQDVDLVAEAVIDAVRHDTALDVTYRIRHKDGRTVWVRMNGRLVGKRSGCPLFLTVLQDLSEATRNYEEALDMALVGTGVVSSDGEVFYANRALRDLADEYFNGSLTELKLTIRATMLEECGQGDGPFEGQIEVLCRDRKFAVRRTQCVWNGRDCTVSYVADITWQMEVELERKSSMADRYSQYLEDKAQTADLDRALSIVELQGAMLDTIANTYIAAYVINFENDSFMKIACKDYVEKLILRFTSAQDVLNCVIEEMISPESRDEAKVFFDLHTLPERLREHDVVMFDYNGMLSGWCRGLFMAVLHDESGRATEALYIVQHIHAEKIKEKKLLEMSETDSLSHLLNRAAGEARINEYLANGKCGMFCLFDIDDFKHCNDTFGHIVGDEAIRQVSACAKRLFRDEDVVMRIGGDEFGIYVPTIADREAGLERIGLLAEQVEQIRLGDYEGALSISTGTVFCKDTGYDSFDQLYSFADTMMYSNKKEKKRKNHLTSSMIPEQVPAAMMMYCADEHEKILFATRELIEMFECENFEDFFDYTGGCFKNIIHPDDAERVEKEIADQIESGGDRKVDYVEYRSRTKNGTVKRLKDYGHLVKSERFGDVFIVAFAEEDAS